MPLLCATRFNKDTMDEFYRWIETYDKEFHVYNTPVKISEKILPNSTLLVLEMNNSTNKLEGIGLIKNKCKVNSNKENKIYSDRNYNRYSYKIGRAHV